LGCPKKQNKFQVNEILKCFTFLVNGHLKFTYALSISKVKIIIYQSFNVETFSNIIPSINFKNTLGWKHNQLDTKIIIVHEVIFLHINARE